MSYRPLDDYSIIKTEVCQNMEKIIDNEEDIKEECINYALK